MVLDEDSDEAKRFLQGKHLPPTPCAYTGKGVHWYFKHPGYPARNFVGKVPGLDFRGDGGYVLAPPNVHPSGRRYTWVDGLSPDDVDPAPCPDRLLELLQGTRQKDSRVEVGSGEPIPEGQRNVTLTSLAGSMRRRGMTKEAIRVALHEENMRRCVPPLPAVEVDRIVESICKYEGGVLEPEARQRDYGHSLVLANLFYNRYRWAPHRRMWMEWDGTRWRPVPEERVPKVAADSLRQHYICELANETDKSGAKRLARLIEESCCVARVSAALSFLKGWDGILTPANEWDRDPWVLNVANGTLDLRTGELRPHNPADLLTKLAPVPYIPGARGPRWEAHLRQFLPNENVRRQVQQELGLCLVGAPLVERLNIWHGTGANGKTTTARVLQLTSGDYAIRAAPDLLVKSKHERHPTEIADLCGSRLVFSMELDEGKVLSEALVKDLSGGDRKKARFMHQDFFEFEQSFGIVLIVNHKPTILGSDEAIWRRIRLVPWEHSIPPDQRRPQEEVVQELFSEGSAILSWLVEGRQDWQEDRHWLAPEVVCATDAYREEQDRLAGFIFDCCELGASFTVGVTELYEAYTDWCNETWEDPVGKRRFGDLLRQRGISQKKGAKGKRRWVGIHVAHGGKSSR